MADSDIELPPDVLSEDEASEESAVELPDQILAGEPCCSKNCADRLSHFAREASSRLNFRLDSLDLDGKNTIWFNQLLNMNRKNPESARRKVFQWHGHELCLRGYSLVSGCPRKKVQQFLRAIAEGEVIVPADARRAPLKKAEPKTEDVDAFFCFIYDNLAEPLGAARDQAEPSSSGHDSLVELPSTEADESNLVSAPDWLVAKDLFNTTSLAITSLKTGEKPSIEKRWLPTMTPAELFDLYKDMHCDHVELASWSTFTRAWSRWQAILGIRPPQVHSRCDDCAKYSKFRRLQSSPADTQAVTESYNRHIREVFADRGIVTSLETSAEQAARNDDLQLPHLVLTIDAMDKSKWQVPRQLDNTKKLAALWRPCLHLVGALVAGVLEYFAVLEADVRGDSDCQQTLLSRALELAEEELRSCGKSMPTRLVFHNDNTSKEGRNSMLLQFAAVLVGTQRAEEVTIAMFKVGHTHNRLDQRFAVIAKLLARASSLETPADYISFLQEHYKPARNVKLVVEEVGGAHHWRMFFDHLATHFAGMTGTQSTADAAHLFRIVRRDSVKSCVPGIPFEEDGQGQPSDPVLLAKHWICSKALSQPPTVLFEGDLGLDFSKLPGMTAPRTMLTDFSVKQYKRTALEVLAAPWQLETASAYLMSWLRRNAGQAEQPPLPDINFIVEGRDFLPLSTAPPTWQDFAPNGAIPVKAVYRKPKAAAMRRPAAARAVPQLAHVSRRAQAASNMASQQPAPLRADDGEDQELNETQFPAASEDEKIQISSPNGNSPQDEAASDPPSPELQHEPGPSSQQGRPAIKRPAAAISQAPVMRRPSAKGQPKASTQPNIARPKVKAKAKARAALQLDDPAVQRILTHLDPGNPNHKLGCSKCRHSAAGCNRCKLRVARSMLGTD